MLSFAKLVVDVAQEIGADFIIKGLRSTIDFESEISQAQINLNVSGVHTLFLPSASANSAIASKYIRDIARFGGDVSSMVPARGRQAPAREVRILMSDPFDPDDARPARRRPNSARARPAPTSSTCSDASTTSWRRRRPMPLSTSVMVNRDEVLDLLDETIERLPDELRAARWLLKEREEYLAKVKREGEDILDQARTRAERMVQRTEVVKASEARARKIVDAATDDAARIKNEVEDFCDQKLASFEIVLERTLKMVGAGRQKLQVSLNTGEEPSIGPRYDDEPGRPGGVRPGPRVVATMAQPILRIGVMELRRRPGTQRDVRVVDRAARPRDHGRARARRRRARGGRHARVDRRRRHRGRRGPGALVRGVSALPRRGRPGSSTSSSARCSRCGRSTARRTRSRVTRSISSRSSATPPCSTCPSPSLCRADCAGPDPETLPVIVAGEESEEPERDPRWAALDALHLEAD